MTDFDDALFPTDVQLGFGVRLAHRGYAEVTNDLREFRNVTVQAPLLRFDLTPLLRQEATYFSVLAFYRARQGSLRSFRFRDWTDYTSARSGREVEDDGTEFDPAVHTQVLGAGDGSRTSFALVKRYEDAGFERIRRITKPTVQGSASLRGEGPPIPITALVNGQVLDPAAYSVDLTAGTLDFATAPAAGEQVEAGFLFDVEVAFGEEADAVFATNFGGYDLRQSPPIELVEVPDTGDVADPLYYGGAVALDVSGAQVLEIGRGLVQVIDTAVSTPTLALPNPNGQGDPVLNPTGDLAADVHAGLHRGGPWMMVHNRSGTSVAVVDDERAYISFSLADGESFLGWVSEGIGTLAPRIKVWSIAVL